MKKLYTLSAFAFLTLAVHAQTFWTENFGTGCNRGQLGSAYVGTNGAWTQSSTGTNDPYANVWYVSAAASGTGVGNCSSSCITSSTQDQTLHIGNPAFVVPSVASQGADTGSTYLTGVFCSLGICSVTNQRIESPTINCSTHINNIASFLYYEGSEPNDNATLMYSADGGVTWTLLDQLAKTVTPCSAPAGTWTSFSIALPISADNNANVKIGFNWSNDGTSGSDPSFAVDDIAIAGSGAGISSAEPMDLEIYSAGNNDIKITAHGHAYKVIEVFNMLGQSKEFEFADNTLHFAEAAEGFYLVNLEVDGQRVVKKVLLR